ncbi:MAG: virulence RhuM family protein, partial [Bacilli bacterium]|nr:virulence RhuM family protein [Bacilli bacterium]
MNKLINETQDIVFYNDVDGNFNVEVLIKEEDVWLNTKSLSQLFKIDRSGIIRHISDIYNDEELDKKSTYAKIAQVQKEGNRKVTREIDYYNLDMIISLGFRVNSKVAI